MNDDSLETIHALYLQLRGVRYRSDAYRALVAQIRAEVELRKHIVGDEMVVGRRAGYRQVSWAQSPPPFKLRMAKAG